MAKNFKFEHILGKVEVYTEENIPSWLKSRAFLWFYEEHILTLEIGQSVETDFNKITRIK